MRRNLLALALGLALLAATPSIASETTEEKAVEIAEAWLALVDEGKYEESWKNAAELFRNAVSAADWEKAVTAARDPFGACLGRKLKSAEFATSLPGAPDGEYVVIQFEAEYEKKSAAIETVTPMKDPDGAWRVAGYFIK